MDDRRNSGGREVELQMGHGQIVCENVPNHKVLRKFLEKRLTKWIPLHDMRSQRTGGWEYFAVFAKEGHGHDVSCHLELTTESGVWQGAEVGEGAQKALIRCLEKMKPIDEPKLLSWV